MSQSATIAPRVTPASRPVERAGIVCCPSDLCGQMGTEKLPWARIVVGIFVAAQTMMLGMTINLTAPEDNTTLMLLNAGMLAATLVVMALLGVPLIIEAVRQLLQRRLTMELLFLVGIGSAMAISVWSMIEREGPIYFEVVNMLLVIYSIGHTITSHSRSKALAAGQAMLDEIATARLENGEIIDVPKIRPRQRIKVMPGELIPVDGVVLEGRSLVRASAFTGEWQATARSAGDSVLAGSACEDGTLVIEATAAGSDRRIDKLANLIASACSSGSPMQRIADRFVRVFLPIVTLIALGTLVFWGVRGNWSEGLFNALAVILVACPCAAGLAVPLATWTAISRLAQRGLLLKSAQSLQSLAEVEAVVFDKTGTLSDDQLQVQQIITAPDPIQRRRTLAILAEVEKHSEHPVARAIRELPREQLYLDIEVLAVRVLPAVGIEADIRLEDRHCTVRLARQEKADSLTIVATLDDIWIATATFTERFRESTDKAIASLKEIGLQTRIMTGDSSAAGQAATRFAPVIAGMTPEEKHSAARQAQVPVLFVGDGVNDAAAMAASHASIAMASGAAITIESADATLHGNDLTVIPDAITLCRRAMSTIRSNFIWAVSYNVVGIALAATGMLHPVVAGILMSVSSAIVAWRSFELRGRAAFIKASASKQVSTQQTQDATGGVTLPSWLYDTSHLAGFIGQGFILIALAQLEIMGSIIATISCIAIALLVIRLARHLPAWLDMTVAMISVGGFGMNLGWWMDLNFDPAIRNGMVAACCILDKTIEATTLDASSHWMYWMMLLLGVPAMYLLRRGPIRFNWRDWCCSGMLILGVPGMCFGMWAGAQLATTLSDYDAQKQVVASYLLMIMGMCAGMLVPHALQLAWHGLRTNERQQNS